MNDPSGLAVRHHWWAEDDDSQFVVIQVRIITQEATVCVDLQDFLRRSM